MKVRRSSNTGAVFIRLKSESGPYTMLDEFPALQAIVEDDRLPGRSEAAAARSRQLSTPR